MNRASRLANAASPRVGRLPSRALPDFFLKAFR